VKVSHRPGEARSEWLAQPPAEWEALLRSISPITDKTSHLRFRWRGDLEQWMLYECMPKRLLAPDRAAQLTQHWSDLPQAEQMGRRRMVSEYQFWMYRTHGVEVRPFWCLQGSKFITGGTPYAFTERERRVMEAEGMEGAEPIPAGMLPNIPFSQTVADAILRRDKLLAVGNNLDALEKENRPEALRAADEETERQYRKAFLKWNHEVNQPTVEFMKWYRHQDAYEESFAPAPDGLANTLSDWKDRFVETGNGGGGVASSRKIQIAVR